MIPRAFAQLAAFTAADSPCIKSKRGVVIFRDTVVVSVAFNAPPHPFRCARNELCRAGCNRVAVHAEERAILLAGHACRGADLAHVKVVDGEPVASGGPSCWQCSRKIVEAGLAGVWLFLEDGWRRYGAGEFHRLTLEANGLPVDL